jgi:hypothetical protein
VTQQAVAQHSGAVANAETEAAATATPTKTPTVASYAAPTRVHMIVSMWFVFVASIFLV